MENFDPNNLKIDENSYKNILIYYIGYITIRDSKYIEIYNVNPLYLIFRNVNGYFEKNSTLVLANESKEKNFKK